MTDQDRAMWVAGIRPADMPCPCVQEIVEAGLERRYACGLRVRVPINQDMLDSGFVGEREWRYLRDVADQAHADRTGHRR